GTLSLLGRSGPKGRRPGGPPGRPGPGPAEPETRTGSGPDVPGGRWIVTERTVRGCRQLIASDGRVSRGLAIQVVAGFPSKADLGWSCGSRVYRDDALTQGWPGTSRGYLVTSEGAISTADPRRVAGLADRALNPWSKPYCSSVAVASAGEHAQRSAVSMHDDGCG